MTPQKQNTHVPVLMDEVLRILDPKEGESYLDLTAGYGGHASAILDRTKAPKTAVLVDRDAHAITSLHRHFASLSLDIRHQDFLQACQNLVAEGRSFKVILADLGISSPHVDNASRGFSFMNEGPLDMRMDQSATTSAETIVNTWPEGELVEVLRQYGEEPQAKRIAHAIVQHRPHSSTTQLANVIATAVGGRQGRSTHPATKSFQALRIAVNDELRQIKDALPLMRTLLEPGGRLGIISFHSLEDRIVKQFLSEYAGDRYDAPLQLLTKKPITASQSEVVSNPRARSAKLRAAMEK